MKQQAKLYRERRPVRGRVGRTGGCRAVALRRGDKGRGTDKAGGELPVRDFGRAALHNRHWLVFCVVIFLSILYMTMHNQSTLYYAKYCLGYENISSLLLTLTPFACVVVAFMPGIGGRVGMKHFIPK